ncbi:hypothetical protein [Paraburkholderia terrae]|uniref:hypothetical protein n=1 Tax=Paraburkholderia terrae TaxID=311230 RepID=UPI001EE2C0E9|nr:hypothetical protein [Paraburkholderia terrae]GJH04580.1 hypothetical protein CBA19C8_28505 [Paraburkholderia terrae]
MNDTKQSESASPSGPVADLHQEDIAGVTVEASIVDKAAPRAAELTLWWQPIPLKGPDWTTTLTEMRVTLTETGPYTYDSLIHFVVDTPVGIAKNTNWTVDVMMQFNLFTANDALVTSFPFQFARGCGRYLLEPKVLRCNSSVAYPVRNTAKSILHTTYMLRVTWC